MTHEQQIKHFEHYWPQYVNYITECVEVKLSPKPFQDFTVNQFDSLLRYKQTGNLINPNPPRFHEGEYVVWIKHYSEAKQDYTAYKKQLFGKDN